MKVPFVDLERAHKSLTAAFHAALDRLPERWRRLLLDAMLIGLVVFRLLKPARVSTAARESTHRIMVGILIGGIVLAAVCLLVFWPR